MDLGIKGRKAIVCASSRGLGKACAMELARAGCDVVINGRDEKTLAATADEISKATGVKVIPVAADVGTPEGQAKLFAAMPSPDILINNNAGPPFRDFRELSRQQMIDGVIANMIVAVELIQKVIDPMTQRGFGRIVNITSSSVKAPIPGLDLSSGARAGLTAFLAGVARTVADKNVTINNVLPGPFETDRLRSNIETTAKKTGKIVRRNRRHPQSGGAGQAVRHAGGIRRGLRVPVLRAGRLHHRAKPAARRRHDPDRVLARQKQKGRPEGRPFDFQCSTITSSPARSCAPAPARPSCRSGRR